MVQNQNTDTIIVNRPPTEFLPNCPPTKDAIHNVYELKMTPELIRYHHTAAGFPTKPQWIAAIKKNNMHCGRDYLLINFFDDSVKNSTSTQRPNFDVF
jgi:hypothetical protein